MLSFRFSPALIYVSSVVRGVFGAPAVCHFALPLCATTVAGAVRACVTPRASVLLLTYGRPTTRPPPTACALSPCAPLALPALRAGLNVRTRWGCRSVGRGNGCAFARLRCVSLARLAACLRARLLVACAASRLSLRSLFPSCWVCCIVIYTPVK